MEILINNPEIIFAGSLILMVIFLLIGSNCKTLPRKTLFYILGTGFGIFGFLFFKQRFSDNLRKTTLKEIQELEAAIKTKQDELKNAENISKAAEAELKKSLYDTQQAKEACEKQILLLNTKLDDQKKEIDNLKGKELSNRFNEYITKIKGEKK